MSLPVFDLHCDTALALLPHGDKPTGNLRSNNGHIDLERASVLPGYCQCFACFTTPFMQEWMKVSPETVFQRELKTILRALEENRDVISQAFSAGDIEDNYTAGRMSAVLTIEGPAGFGFDPSRLEDLYKTGFLITSLGWNEKNILAGSNVTGGGLTDMGREYIKEAQRLGMIIDVSHISDEAFWDIIDVTQAPVIATHSNSRTVCDHSRNLTDDMFRAICETGGVAGFNQCDAFVGVNPDLDSACRHFLHFLEMDPSGTHIALGADLDGCDVLPLGFDGIQSYPRLEERLRSYGVDEQILRNVFWNNALGVMKRCCI